MGGRGSGRLFRWDAKTALEQCRCIDVRDWKRRGLLREGSGFSWAWWQDGVRKASIRVLVAFEQVRLSYRYQRNGCEWRDVDDGIPLAATPCHLGGERVWFFCPGCGQRAAKLYLYSPYFRCRSCCRLPYASQQETALDRASRKARKLRRKLSDEGGIGDPIWEKPKGMHRRTFERLKAKAEEQDGIADFAFLARASKLIGWALPRQRD
jgi:hypothetical protein